MTGLLCPAHGLYYEPGCLDCPAEQHEALERRDRHRTRVLARLAGECEQCNGTGVLDRARLTTGTEDAASALCWRFGGAGQVPLRAVTA